MVFDVVIIGAGQAGLAMGYLLKDSNLSFIILDKSSEVGEVWRNRYDSLTLFTPRYFSSLPGLDFVGSHDKYPTKAEVAHYLLTYASTFSLPIQNNTNVEDLRQFRDGFKIATSKGEFHAKQVVIATGPFQKPFVPDWSKCLSNKVFQVHSADYKNPLQLNKGSVLVVGGGNSGSQIAVELSKDRDVYLSVGHKMKFIPQNIGNKSVFWYFDKLGIYTASSNSIIGQFIKKRPDPIFGLELKKLLKTGVIKLKSKATGSNDNIFKFEDNTELQVENVVWSTGFRMDYSWLNVSNILNEKGFPIHKRGVTPIEGLFFLGLPWQNSRGSALIHGVGKDAKHLVKYILK